MFMRLRLLSPTSLSSNGYTPERPGRVVVVVVDVVDVVEVEVVLVIEVVVVEVVVVAPTIVVEVVVVVGPASAAPARAIPSPAASNIDNAPPRGSKSERTCLASAATASLVGRISVLLEPE
jgi:hypothetical protein